MFMRACVRESANPRTRTTMITKASCKTATLSAALCTETVWFQNCKAIFRYASVIRFKRKVEYLLLSVSMPLWPPYTVCHILSLTHTRARSVMFNYNRAYIETLLAHPRAYLFRVKRSQAKRSFGTRYIVNRALKAASGVESVIEGCIANVNLIDKYATWVYPKQRLPPRHPTCADLPRTRLMAIWRLGRTQRGACWDGVKLGTRLWKPVDEGTRGPITVDNVPRRGATIVRALSAHDESGGAKDQHGHRVVAVIFSLPRFRFNRFSIVFHGIVARLLSSSRCHRGLDTDTGT